MRPDKYILEGHAPRAASLEEWAVWFEANKDARRVAVTKIGDVTISTFFLGLNHRWDDEGLPLLFETMIFGGSHNEEQWRYSTWDDAEAGHAMAVELVKQDGAHDGTNAAHGDAQQDAST